MTRSLADRLGALMLRDADRLSRRLESVRRTHAERRSDSEDDLRIAVESAESRVLSRQAAVPQITYPQELPVTGRHDDLAAAIRDNQVVVVAGETGSGKTTQLPKICLELGRGVRGMIGHTQPRRIAARTVAERIAQETGTEVGGAVGYAVRFADHVGADTLLKVMTDGILLTDMQRDRTLLAYDTLIIDEAHERSLNIDFILGYLRRLLPRRPDLKVIITSATIDPQRFADAFGGAPVVEVSGRTYPVEVRYRPLLLPDPGAEDEELPPARAADAARSQSTKQREAREQVVAIADAVDELVAEGPGDILVFLSGEREIRDAARHLGEHLQRRRLHTTEVLPLYSRLSAAEQHKIFQPHTGRRIVLATNVAETSLTVPGIRYVIDTGLARISRYSQRLKVQRLPIEPISQASARQRSGRCGRTDDGIAIRLYDEEDFAGRPVFTDPEITRTNLASVILSMIALDLGDIAAFPFLDPPDRRAVRDGLDLLHELNALEHRPSGAGQRLTATGRRLAQLPVDPRMARMLVEADRLGCLREVLVIVSALSIQDPRERPAEEQQAADASHARFADPDSDFTAYLNLWTYLREQRRERSANGFRRMCRDEYLHYLRIREWQDLHAQLGEACRELDMSPVAEPAGAAVISQSLLAGLLSHVGMRDPQTRDYLGARNAHFSIFPGSALAKKAPAWVMAGELVETSRLFARDVARTDPAWVEAAAQHLVKRQYSEPHWSRKRAAVLASERVTLYGIPLVAGRRVSYGSIDPELSRELFLRHALVQGEWDTRHPFFAANRALLESVADLEDRVRRRDILVDDDTLFDFYDARLGAEVVSGRHFDTWWKRARQRQPDLLDLERSLLVRSEAVPADVETAFPDAFTTQGVELPLSYAFEPGTEVDGITVEVPLTALHQLDPTAFAWQVPGHRLELVTALIRTLPKAWRRSFVPAPDHARAVLPELTGNGSPVEQLAIALRRRTGVPVPPDAFDPAAVPDHLRMNFAVVDGAEVVGTGRDLEALREQLADRLRSSLNRVAPELELTGLTSWSIGDLPRVVTRPVGSDRVTGYPALVDERTSVGVRVLESASVQEEAMRAGTRRLLLLTTPAPAAQVTRRLGTATKLVLAASPYSSVGELLADCAAAAVDWLVEQAGGQAWTASGFEALRTHVRADLVDVTASVVQTTAEVLELAGEVRQAVGRVREPAAVEDLRAQLTFLVHDGFVAQVGRTQLAHLPRYLRGMLRRIDRLATEPRRDAQEMATVQALEDAYDEALAERGLSETAPQVRAARWMLEELRVSLFAQTLGTAGPVSAKRVRTALAALR
ncbi:MAG: ATP-dependent helicase HrpA [uncultured Nocardioidaceae bacterium]|uniref:ATP-dependent helicase HrpA n=1 Tax=uncultured Nocardioidaceae bacterium TaxID=253824 RepID=A0A6J4M309_9ACTN|nr:MAG: ATP-dependent helicase HrpA [uncultured Nocardioidaceae bacterium]